jgi:hypothetical protein
VSAFHANEIRRYLLGFNGGKIVDDKPLFWGDDRSSYESALSECEDSFLKHEKKKATAADLLEVMKDLHSHAGITLRTLEALDEFLNAQLTSATLSRSEKVIFHQLRRWVDGKGARIQDEFGEIHILAFCSPL